MEGATEKYNQYYDRRGEVSPVRTRTLSRTTVVFELSLSLSHTDCCSSAFLINVATARISSLAHFTPPKSELQSYIAGCAQPPRTSQRCHAHVMLVPATQTPSPTDAQPDKRLSIGDPVGPEDTPCPPRSPEHGVRLRAQCRPPKFPATRTVFCAAPPAAQPAPRRTCASRTKRINLAGRAPQSQNDPKNFSPIPLLPASPNHATPAARDVEPTRKLLLPHPPNPPPAPAASGCLRARRCFPRRMAFQSPHPLCLEPHLRRDHCRASPGRCSELRVENILDGAKCTPFVGLHCARGEHRFAHVPMVAG